jgi:hypothetical protein
MQAEYRLGAGPGQLAPNRCGDFGLSAWDLSLKKIGSNVKGAHIASIR